MVHPGPLRIYRAPGSVAFLNCATALKPILPKSQAWCVDGDSKFVIQIRRPQYWRIEVSNQTEADKAKVDDLKKVLGNVLLFEKTPCPFQRDFVVELPEAPKTPIVKRPWRPSQGPIVEKLPIPEASTERGYGTPPTRPRGASSSPLRRHTPPVRGNHNLPVECLTTRLPSEHIEIEDDLQLGSSEVTAGALSKGSASTIAQVLAANNNILERAIAVPLPDCSNIETKQEDAARVSPSLPNLDETDTSECQEIVSTSSGLPLVNSSDNVSENACDSSRECFQFMAQCSTCEPESRNGKPQSIKKCNRSITAPPILSLITSPPSQQRTISPVETSAVSESGSNFSSSVESFHTVQSWHSPLAPPSPTVFYPLSPTKTYPYPHDNITILKRPQHIRETSELTVTPNASRVWDVTATPGSERSRRDSSPVPKTPTLSHDSSDKSDEEQFEVLTPPTVRRRVDHRATTSSNSRRRELSPLPAAVNLFSPTKRRPRRLQTARHLPTAIIQKTCEILLSPPSHLFHLMISIASKIAAGEWSGFLRNDGEAVHWDFEDEYAGAEWHEDDYGVSLSSTPKVKAFNNRGSWEID